MYGTAMISQRDIQRRLTECLTGPWGRPMPQLRVEGSPQEAMGVQSVLAQLNSHLMRERRRRQQERHSPTHSLASD